LITNLSFYGRFSTEFSSPADNHLGLWVILVPVVGGVIVGIMARYGSAAIRGHGIPEAMEQVLYNESRVPPRVTILKPVSAAFAIGTGGPFGAEGPIIATGGALGSLVGQLLRTTADERKVRLARRPAWRRRSAVRCPRCCSPSSCCCSSIGRGRWCPWRWRRRQQPRCVSRSWARVRFSRCPTSPSRAAPR